MNKIICCLLLFINFNLMAVNKPVDIIYESFVQEMLELDPDALLQWFMDVTLAKDALKVVLRNNIPKTITEEKEKQSYNLIIEELVNKKNNEEKIENIKKFFINQKKIQSTDKTDKKELDYTKDLVEDILNNIMDYIKTSIKILYKETFYQEVIDKKKSLIHELEQKESTPDEISKLKDEINTLADKNRTLLIEFLNLENEDKPNHFLSTQKTTLINFLKKANSFTTATATPDSNNKKTLSLLENECAQMKIKPIKKAALLAFYFASIAHHVAEGHGDEFTSSISHSKLLIGKIDETNKYFNDIKYPFNGTLAFSIHDKSNPLDGKRENGLIIPAHYIYIISKTSSNGLVGNKDSFLLAPPATVELEKKIRTLAVNNDQVNEMFTKINTLVNNELITEKTIKKIIAILSTKKLHIEEIVIDTNKSLKNINILLLNNALFIDAIYQDGTHEEEVKINRFLSLFDNKLNVPQTWYPLQTNLFCSDFVSPFDNSIYPTQNREFNPNKAIFNEKGYIKLLQHVMNFNDLTAKYPHRKVKGYFASKKIVPRSIVLGNNKYGTQLCYVAHVAKDTNYYLISTKFNNAELQRDAYQCKNNNNNNRQMLIAYMGYNQELEFPVLKVFAKNSTLDEAKTLCFKGDTFDKDTVLKNLKNIFINLGSKGFKYDMLSMVEKDGSTSYYCLNHPQLYPEYLIEYDPSLIDQ